MTRPAALRPGSSGEAVRDLQRRVVALGFEIPRDEFGFFGDGTESAVRAFQSFRGIRVDGVCGAETWTAVFDSGFRLGDRLLCVRRPMLRGDDVTELQRRLNALGFDAGKEDGIFGPDTEGALAEFQRNAGIAVDRICGRETIATLDRLDTRAGGAVAVVRERDAMRDPRNLAGYRVYIGAGNGFDSVARALVDGLLDAGAEASLDLATTDESLLAAAANDYAAHLFVAIRARSATDGDPAAGGDCRCCYFSSGTFRSEAGFAVATAVAEALAEVLGSRGTACGRTYTVLRETRMTALVCEPVIEGDSESMRLVLANATSVADAALRAIRGVLEGPPTPG